MAKRRNGETTQRGERRATMTCDWQLSHTQHSTAAPVSAASGGADRPPCQAWTFLRPPLLTLITMPPYSRQIIRPATYMRTLSFAASTSMQKLIWVSSFTKGIIASLTLPVSLSLAQNPCLRSLSSHSLSCNSYSILSVSSLASHSGYGSTAVDSCGNYCLM